MEDGKDADLGLGDPVPDDIGKVGDYQLTSAVNSPGTAKAGVIGERVDRSSDRGVNTRCRPRVVLCDELADRFKVVERRAAPNNLHPAL